MHMGRHTTQEMFVLIEVHQLHRIFISIFSCLIWSTLSSAVHYWILWFSSPMARLGWAERSKCVFALKYWYCVYASMSKSHFHRLGIGNVNIAISSRVIVIFVEYDFIYRCHYAVATLLFPVDVQCKLALSTIFLASIRTLRRQRGRGRDWNRICQHYHYQW